MNKQILRKQFLQQRDGLLQETVAAHSKAVFATLLQMPVFLEAQHVMIYIGFRNEIETLPIIEWLLQKGRTVSVPVCKPEGKMHIVKLESVQTGLQKNKFGILEPISACPPDTLPNLAIVPGVVFDVSGRRIGFGKGYYDRYFSGKSIVKIGICHDFQMIQTVPQDRFDIKMNYIVSEERILSL